jgi:hypothetical protein
MLPTKKRQRKPRFAPPKVPKTEDLKAHQCYGIITGYHGGARREMDVTIYDSIMNELKDVKCKLKGSLRHAKCRQQVIIGSLVVTDYEDVIIIFTSSQYGAVPDNIYRKLMKHHDALQDQNEDDDEDDEDELVGPELSSDDEDDDAVVFDADADADANVARPHSPTNIDLI